jgi:N-acetylneuraminic acid mutarotase
VNKLLIIFLTFVLSGCSGFQSTSGLITPSQMTPNPQNQNPQSLRSAWVSGSAFAHQQGIYGTLGTPSSSNAPGSRTWMAAAGDASGNLWVFGGEGLDGNPVSNGQYSGGDLNDLWTFSTSTKMWTWVSGSSSAGQPTSASGPGARHGSVGACDPSGNFWVFGGNNGSNLNELWKFSPSSKQWTQVVGTAASPIPGRIWSTAWTDPSGNLWVFGGQAFTIINDLWKYSPGQNQWTLVSGTNSSVAAGVYGIKGVPNANNVPGARRNAVGWSDTQGNLWLFGGDGADASGNIQNLNDLWKFDTKQNIWTWVSGSSSAGAVGFYGFPGVSSAFNSPGARSSSYTWIDKSGHLWLLGGIGADTTNNPNLAALNDLWMFAPESGNWTWMAGANSGNAIGQYGALNGFDSKNFPGARKLGASWVDTSGNFWLFGGSGFDSAGHFQDLNDAWEIQH